MPDLALVQVTGSPQESFALAYSPNLTLQPIRHKLRSWHDDYKTVQGLLAAFRPSSANALPAEAPPANADTVRLGSFNEANTSLPSALARSFEHCSAAGVTCNGVGRVVHLDMSSQAGQVFQNSTAPMVQADKGVGLALELPWLVAVSWKGSPVQGQLPRLAELGASMPLV
jgi:hypothetical protein